MKKRRRAAARPRRKGVRRPAGGRRGPAPARRQNAIDDIDDIDDIDIRALPAGDIDALRAEIEKSLPSAGSARWNADPTDVQRSVAKLVLTLMEFLRKLLERQAIRRMETGTLTDAEVEAVGLALMRLEETLRTMGERFGLTPDELNLDLGPLGRLI
jgi:hypothetical protein